MFRQTRGRGKSERSDRMMETDVSLYIYTMNILMRSNRLKFLYCCHLLRLMNGSDDNIADWDIDESSDFKWILNKLGKKSTTHNLLTVLHATISTLWIGSMFTLAWRGLAFHSVTFIRFWRFFSLSIYKHNLINK